MNYQYLSTTPAQQGHNHAQRGSKKGFTLIELLVVISIIGFLATLIVISLNDSRTKSFDTRRLVDVIDAQKAIELYNNQKGEYPTGANLELGSGTSCGGSACGCLSEDGFSIVCPSDKIIYMGVVPANPGPGGKPYIYNQTSDGQSFTIDFRIETDIGDILAGDHILTPDGIQ